MCLFAASKLMVVTSGRCERRAAREAPAVSFVVVFVFFASCGSVLFGTLGDLH